jgi:hypothetical protein
MQMAAAAPDPVFWKSPGKRKIRSPQMRYYRQVTRAARSRQLSGVTRISSPDSMSTPPLLIVSCLCLSIVCGGLFLGAQSDLSSLPARDSHQGVTVAVKPYVTEKSYQDQFGKRTPYEAGILALEVFFRNDNDRPIRVNLGAIRLLVSRQGEPTQRLEQLSAETVADRVLLQTPADPRRPRLPFPIGGRPATSARDKNWLELAERLRAAGVKSDLLAPRSTVRGFLYFDINHHFDWLAGARLDVPDLAFMLDNQALFFFQVDLAPALR